MAFQNRPLGLGGIPGRSARKHSKIAFPLPTKTKQQRTTTIRHMSTSNMQRCTHCGHGIATHNPYCHGHGHGGYYGCLPHQPAPAPASQQSQVAPQQHQQPTTPWTYEDVSPAIENLQPTAPTAPCEPPAAREESLLVAKVDALTALVGKLAAQVEQLEKGLGTSDEHEGVPHSAI